MGASGDLFIALISTLNLINTPSSTEPPIVLDGLTLPIAATPVTTFYAQNPSAVPYQGSSTIGSLGSFGTASMDIDIPPNWGPIAGPNVAIWYKVVVAFKAVPPPLFLVASEMRPVGTFIGFPTLP